MRPEDVRKLVGGYATGTLTREERRALLEAALSDQDLYNELAREQPLKELLDDPRARRQLIDAVTQRRPLLLRLTGWLGRPASWALAGGLAAVVLLVVVFVRTGQPPSEPQPVLTAKREAKAVLPSEIALPPPVKSIPLPKRPAEKLQAEAREEAPAALAVAPKSIAVPLVPAPMADAPKPVAAPAVGTFRANFAAQRVAVPYRMLRADAEDRYAEVEPQTVFRAEDRLRIAFDPPEAGRLRVTTTDTGGALRVLLDADLQKAVTMNLDLPPGEQKLVVWFTPASASQPTVFEIQLRR